MKLLQSEFEVAVTDSENLFFSLKNHDALLKFTFAGASNMIKTRMPHTHSFFTRLLTLGSHRHVDVRAL